MASAPPRPLTPTGCSATSPTSLLRPDARMCFILTERGIDTLVACGQRSEGCLHATTTDALRQHFDVVAVSDAHSTLEDAGMVIARQNTVLTGLGAVLKTTAEVVAAGYIL